jgi:hypothetical protein
MRALRWILIGLACSIPFHAAAVAWLAATLVQTPGNPKFESMVTMDVSSLPADGLPAQVPGGSGSDVMESPGVESTQQDPMASTALGPLDGSPGEGTGLAEGGASGFGLDGSLAGGGRGTGTGGGGGGGGLGGGSGTTSFFGVGGTGQRFAFVVDKSGSMANFIEEAKGELRKSIAALPDYASIYVIFYDSGDPLNFSDRWERVRTSTMARLGRWLRDVGPSGGTEPTRAFHRVFELDVRPDVVFFLSDGEIPEESVTEIRRLNATGRKVTVNTIAFGDDAGGARLRRVAQDSGGEFRHVRPKGGGR